MLIWRHNSYTSYKDCKMRHLRKTKKIKMFVASIASPGCVNMHPATHALVGMFDNQDPSNYNPGCFVINFTKPYPGKRYRDTWCRSVRHRYMKANCCAAWWCTFPCRSVAHPSSLVRVSCKLYFFNISVFYTLVAFNIYLKWQIYQIFINIYMSITLYIYSVYCKFINVCEGFIWQILQPFLNRKHDSCVLK